MPRSRFELLHEVDGLVVDFVRRRAGDAIVLDTLFLAVADDVVLERDAGLATRADQIPVDGHLVTGDDPAPVGFEQDVVDRGAAGLSARAGGRLAGFRVKHERDDPRLYVVAALGAGEVEGALFGETVTLLDPVDAEELADDVYVTVGQDESLRGATGEYHRVLGEHALDAALKARLRDVVHQVVGADHENSFAAQLFGDLGEEHVEFFWLSHLHSDELVLAGRQRGVDDQAVQFTPGCGRAHFGRKEHQIGVDRVGVESVKLTLVAARETALDHVRDAQVAQLAAGIVRPDHLHRRG